MSFRLKTILGIAVIEALTLSLLIWTSLNFLKTSNEQTLLQRASTTALLFATMSTNAVLALDLASLESSIEELLRNPGVVYGRIISNSEGVLAEGGQAEALSRQFEADRSFHFVGDGVLDVQSAISVGGTAYGMVQIGLDITELQKLVGTARNRITVLAVAEMALTAFFSLLLGIWLTRQLASLAEGARQISDGKLGYQVPIRGSDELAETATTFNQMSLDLQHSYRELTETLVEVQKAGRKLKVSEAKMRAVLENAVDGIITINSDGIIQSFNPAAERIFGYPSEEVMGRNVKILVPEPIKKRHDEYIRRYLETGIARIIGIGRETEAERKDGERFPIDLGISEIRVDQQRLFTGIVRDISKRKQTEEELGRHRERLEQLVEERTRDLKQAQRKLVEQAYETGRAQLAAVMLHNIGNAVTPLLAHVDALKKSLPDHVVDYLEKSYAELKVNQDRLTNYVGSDERGRKVFGYLGELIGYMKQFRADFRLHLEKMGFSLDHVGEILAIQQADERGQSGRRSMVNLNELVVKALKIWEDRLQGRSIVVYRNLALALPELELDPNRFLHAMTHVIKNACEAIDFRPGGDPRREISVSTFFDEEHVVVEIRDSGVGIAPDRVQALLSSQNLKIGAEGFGLYFCRLFMQISNGQLRIESPGVGLGATVTFVFSRSR